MIRCEGEAIWLEVHLAVAIALALTLLAGAARAGTLGVGSEMPHLVLEDQHGARVEVDATARVVVLSRDMDAGDVVKHALSGFDQGALDLRGAVYVADISGMPGLIARMFAIPKLRERSYRVLLDRDGAATRDLPYVEGRPTVLVLEAGRIARIEHPATAEELRRALDPPPAA